MQPRPYRWPAAALIAVCLFANVQADFQDGVNAYRNKQYTDALREFEALGQQGLAIAQSYVGVMYVLGQGVEKDLPQAMTWFEQAAKQGNAEAALTLGGFAYHGEGRDKSLVDAYAWYSLSAAAGSDQATDILARLTTELSRDEIRQAQTKAEALYSEHNRPAWKNNPN